MAEIDLLVNYPKAKRNVEERGLEKTQDDRVVGRLFGKEYFDGDRRFGYGGYSYMPRFWQPVMPTFQKHFNLTKDSSLLDVGSGKGFMLHDLVQLISGIRVQGIDISEYAIANTIEDIKPFVKVGNAKKLPFPDKSFDLVLTSAVILHNAPEIAEQMRREVVRVSRHLTAHNEDILTHCRDGLPHVRDCWVVALILRQP